MTYNLTEKICSPPPQNKNNNGSRVQGFFHTPLVSEKWPRGQTPNTRIENRLKYNNLNWYLSVGGTHLTEAVSTISENKL